MFTGEWLNERGSAMVLEQQGNRISGHYVTRIGNEAVAGADHPITGFANGATIGVVVAWPGAGSVTSWVGRLETDAEATPGFTPCGISHAPAPAIHRASLRFGKAF